MVKKNIINESKVDNKSAESNEAILKRMAEKEAGIERSKAKVVEEVVAEEVLEEPKKKAE